MVQTDQGLSSRSSQKCVFYSEGDREPGKGLSMGEMGSDSTQ